jgi:mannose-1-phosphate guanylyltransferase/mannose-6-phosphate isomerase
MIPVILSGGSGTRLWPVSRQSMPKQFCEFLDESLFIKTLKRLLPLGSPWTVTVRDLQVLTSRALRELAVPLEQAIYEPFGKNTAPAIALLCHVLSHRGLAEEVVGVFPADQLIDDAAAFVMAVRKGEAMAKLGHIVTLGVKPTHPATGYGYIETAGPFAGGSGALQAVGFREKPNESTARDFIARGGFYWNAGMFIFKVSKMIEHLKAFAPDVWNVIEGVSSDLKNLPEVYAKVRSISFDYAVMERLSSHVCIPCSFTWSDLGSWDAIAEELDRTGVAGAAPGASHLQIDVSSSSNFVFPQAKKTYAFVGCEDLIVVDTPDALLVTRKGASERVKEVVDQLKSQSDLTATQHQFEVRPWGRFHVLVDGDNFKSKSILVDAGAQLSYQSHQKRAEHWIIIKGEGEVILDGETIAVGEGQHIHIPIGSKHRIRNTGSAPLQFVEVQLGSYFGESDITRYEDDYSRV